MKLNIERYFGPEGEVFTFRGEFTGRDMARLELSELDRLLLNDVSSDPDATAADYLLALEMLYRRHAEQRSSRTRLER